MGLVTLAAIGEGGCKKKLEDEKGRLRTMSANLEEAYGNAPLPNLTEPVSLAERVEKWDDFRSCTVRTYVARKRDAERRMREGRARRTRHASIGDETIEECATELAVAKKDKEICNRLAVDYAGPNGEMPLSAVRCWDTRARVFGLPEECPIIRFGSGQISRNPECLAVALRDQSLCPFTDSPGRCRALLINDVGPCHGQDAADDCELAVDYWRGLIPLGLGPPRFDPAKLAEKTSEKPLAATFDLRWPKHEHERLQVKGPKFATAISWPSGKMKTAVEPEGEKFWGSTVSDDALAVTWNMGSPALKLAFVPGASPSGTRQLEAPSPGALATFIAVWGDDPAHFLRCVPGANTQGEVTWNAGGAQPGDFVDGSATAKRLVCSDGTEMELSATFRLLIIDTR